MLRVAGVVVALLALFLAELPARAESGVATIRQEAVPDWVDFLPDVTALDGLASNTALDEGLRYLLRDHQFIWTDGYRQIWERRVASVTSEDAIGEVRLQIFEFNASLEVPGLTSATIWRDGQEINLMGTPQIRAEYISSGDEFGPGYQQRYAMVSVDDLRPGDILDLSVLRRPVAREPTEADLSAPDAPGQDRWVYDQRALEREAVAPLEFADPVTLARVVVNWPQGWRTYRPQLPEAVTLSTGPIPSGGTRYDYQLFDATRPSAEEQVPAWIDELAVLRQNADKDWRAVTAGLSGHYTSDWPLGSWEARLAGLGPKAGEALSPDVMMAALKLVQSEIYDPGISWAAGTRLATVPAEVVQSGYGTAVDKALLLRTLLRRLGFEADIALTSGIYGPALDRLQPSILYLDTAVVRVRHQGRDWWLDPSELAQEVSAGAMKPLPYGFALLLMADSAEPVVIPADPAALWSSDVREKWRITPAGLFLDVVSEHRGGAADDLRFRLANGESEEITDELHGFYRSVFPEMVMIRAPEVQDEPADNVMQIHERYFLSAGAIRRDGLSRAFPLAAEDFTSDLPPQSAAKGRKWPLAGPAPGHYRQRTELWSPFAVFSPPPAVQLENPAFRYSVQGFVPKPGRLVVEWDYLARGASVMPADLAQVLEDAEVVYETTWFEVNLEGGP